MEMEKIIEFKRQGRSLNDPSSLEYNARIGFSSDMSLGYTEGYKKAGRILFQHLDGNRFWVDMLVYPIVYCYRHHLELQLKRIIKFGYTLLEQEDKTKHVHPLKTLWLQAKELLNVVYQNNDTKEYIACVEYYIFELDTLDPSGFEFRYDKRKDGDSTLLNTKFIHLDNLVDILEELCNCIGAIAYDLEMNYEYQCDMYRQVQQSMMESRY
jgi:hypothetical protein